VYVDANKNSMLDSGEAGIGGITVTLKNSSGNVIATTTTAANGTYSFTGLAAGPILSWLPQPQAATTWRQSVRSQLL